MSRHPPNHVSLPVRRYTGDKAGESVHNVAVETPVALVYQGLSHVVMMATPDDLTDFGLGFSLSERILASAEELKSIEAVPVDKGIVLRMTIPHERFQAIFDQHRHLPGRTGCGLCGVESLEQAVPDLPQVPQNGQVIKPQAVYQAFERLHAFQPEKRATGAVHAAAWCTPDGEIQVVREDVGRHNALDKLIGAMAGAGLSFGDGFCLITSRCSYEMVQKAVQMGMPMIAAISAPTTFAVDLAERHNLTLLALARQQTFTVFAHGHRVADHPAKVATEESSQA